MDSSDWNSEWDQQRPPSDPSASPHQYRYHGAHDDSAPTNGGPESVLPDSREAVPRQSGQPSASPPAAGRRDLRASADELDRLTNEILARVAQISDDRQQKLEELAAADRETSRPRRADTDSRSATHPLDRSQSPRTGSSDGDRPLSPNATFRADTGHGQVPAAHTAPRPAPPQPTAPSTTTRRVSVAASSSRNEGASDNSAPRTTNWASSVGQALAYLGILGLTAGTSLVIVSYFGGSASPRIGWLVSTIGQMLLFLGIVTLVSGGMEQTTEEVRRTVDEVSKRLDSIGERLIRIESEHESGPRRPHMLDHQRDRTTSGDHNDRHSQRS